MFGVILVRIQSECVKIRTRITPNMDTFHAVKVTEILSNTFIKSIYNVFYGQSVLHTLDNHLVDENYAN